MRTNTQLLNLMLQFQSDLAELIKLWGQDAKMMDALNKDTKEIFFENNSYTWPEDMTAKFIEASYFCEGKDGLISKNDFSKHLHETYFGEGHLDEKDEELISKQLNDVWKDLPEYVTNKHLTQHLINTKVTDELDKDFFNACTEGIYEGTLQNSAEAKTRKSLLPVIDEIRQSNSALNTKLATFEYEFLDNKENSLIKASRDWDYVDRKSLTLAGMLYMDYETQRTSMQSVVWEVFQENSNSAKRMLAAGKDFVIESPAMELNITRIAKTKSILTNEEQMRRNDVLKQCKNESQIEIQINKDYAKQADAAFAKEKSEVIQVAKELKNEAEIALDEFKTKQYEELEKLNKKLEKAKDNKEEILDKIQQVKLSQDVALKAKIKEFESINFDQKAKEIVSEANNEIKQMRITPENIKYACLNNTTTRLKAQEAFAKLNGEEKLDVVKLFEAEKLNLAKQKEDINKRLADTKTAVKANLQETLNYIGYQEKKLSANKQLLLNKTDNAQELKAIAKQEVKQPKKERQIERDELELERSK